MGRYGMGNLGIRYEGMEWKRKAWEDMVWKVKAWQGINGKARKGKS